MVHDGQTVEPGRLPPDDDLRELRGQLGRRDAIREVREMQPEFHARPSRRTDWYAALHQSQPCNRLAAWASPHDSTAAARTGLESGNIATNTMEESMYGA